jgi:hypothetical protein
VGLTPTLQFSDIVQIHRALAKQAQHSACAQGHFDSGK